MQARTFRSLRESEARFRSAYRAVFRLVLGDPTSRFARQERPEHASRAGMHQSERTSALRAGRLPSHHPRRRDLGGHRECSTRACRSTTSLIAPLGGRRRGRWRSSVNGDPVFDEERRCLRGYRGVGEGRHDATRRAGAAESEGVRSLAGWRSDPRPSRTPCSLRPRSRHRRLVDMNTTTCKLVGYRREEAARHESDRISCRCSATTLEKRLRPAWSPTRWSPVPG